MLGFLGLNTSWASRFLKDHVIGMVVFAIATGVAGNCIYDNIKKPAYPPPTSSASPSMPEANRPSPCPANSVCGPWVRQKGEMIALNLAKKHLWKFDDYAGEAFEHTIEADVYLPEASGEYHVLVMRTSPADRWFECHSCYPHMSFHTFKLVNAIWMNWDTTFSAYIGGGWGDSPSDVVGAQIGTSKFGIVVHDSYLNQGCLSSWVVIFAMLGGAPEEILTIREAESCGGSGDEVLMEDDYDTACRFEEKRGGAFYDIQIDREFVTPGKAHHDSQEQPLYARQLLRFDGKGYRTVDGVMSGERRASRKEKPRRRTDSYVCLK